MKKLFLLCLISTFTFCDKPNELTKEEAFKVIISSYKFKHCYSAVGDIRSLGLNEIELEGYDYSKTYSHGKGIVVKGMADKIIGISISENNKNEARVAFTIKYVKTPLYNIKGHKRFDEPSSCSLWKEKEKEVKLVKYDNGWRIKK